MKNLIPFRKSPARVNVLRLNGAIMTRQGSLNDQALAPAIERAFRRGKPAAVALSINSPGGSPVQSSLIAARITRLSSEKNVPVFAFVEDVAASGGYWLACAAEKIYADASSIVGSIGVISAGFGLNQFIEKHGIERRVYTSGRSKSQLDPFQPENPDDVARLRSLQEEIHTQFIDHVRAARDGKLQEGDQLFDGSFWTGGKAAELGVIDGLGHLIPMMKDRYGDKTRFAVFGPRKPLFRRIGSQIASGMRSDIEEQAIWSRFGL